MILYKYHSKSATVNVVEGEPWPGMDSDGEPCHDNTHFATEAEAWDAMVRDVSAGISLTAHTVERLREKLKQAEANAATAGIAFASAMAKRKATA